MSTSKRKATQKRAGRGGPRPGAGRPADPHKKQLVKNTLALPAAAWDDLSAAAGALEQSKACTAAQAFSEIRARATTRSKTRSKTDG